MTITAVWIGLEDFTGNVDIITCIDNMVVHATLHEHSSQDCQNLHRTNSNEEKDF